MDEAATRYTLATLQKKRASLAGEIDDFKRKIAHRERALRHVDAVLRLLAPEADPSTIPKRRPRRVKLFRQGELGRMIVAVLRKSGTPMMTSEVVTRLIEECGLTGEARKTLSSRIRGNLAYLATVGRVEKIGQRANARWSAVRRSPAIISRAAA